MTDIKDILKRVQLARQKINKEHHSYATKQQLVAIGIIAGVILIALSVLFFTWEKPTGHAIEEPRISVLCENPLCFVENGKNCYSSTFTTKVATVTIAQKVNKDCTIYRQVVAVDPTESERMKTLQGLSMICYYKKGLFNPRYADTIIGVPSQCEGPLLERAREIALQVLAET